MNNRSIAINERPPTNRRNSIVSKSTTDKEKSRSNLPMDRKSVDIGSFSVFRLNDGSQGTEYLWNVPKAIGLSFH
jgi:hypothetical protein